MKLSTGKVLTFTREANGSQTINQELTEAEWEEYCAIRRVQEIPVPHVTVSSETAYGKTVPLSFGIRVF